LRTTGSLGDPSTYGQALIFAGAILLHRAAGTAQRGLRLVYFGVSMIAFFCVFFSFSRSTWLAGLLAFGGLAYLYPRRILPFSLFAVLASAVVGVVFFSEQIEFAGRRLYSQGSERAAVTRFPVYIAGIRMFLEKPITGWGYANFDRFDREFQGRIDGVFDDNKDHASHNFYLTMLSEQGLVGFCLFLFPAIWWLGLSVKKRLRLGLDGFQSRHLLLILWLSVIGHLLLINFHNIRNPFAWGLWWLALGWIAAMTDDSQNSMRRFAFATDSPGSADGTPRGTT
jgi:O-antigen ligase